MIARFTQALHSLHSWYSSTRNHCLLVWARRLLTLGVIAASTWFIGKRLRSDYASLSGGDIDLEPSRLLASWLFVTASTALGAWEWSLLVNALGGDLDNLPGMRIHLVSGLTKYVPGGVWSYLGKVLLATEQGVPAGVATASVVGEFFIVFFDGLLLLVLSFPHSAVSSWSLGWKVTAQIIAILLSGASIAAIPFLGPRLVKIGWPAFEENIKWGQVVLVVIAVLLTWGLLSLGFSILGTGDEVSASPNTSHRFFTLASAMLAGQIAFFAPIGLGVREAVLVGLLGGWYPTTFILVIALVFRIEMTLGEVVCAVTAVGADRLATRRG